MKSVFIISLFIIVVTARPQDNPNSGVTVTKNEFENTQDNGYKFAYELSDGQTRQEEGTITNPGAENEGIAIKGSYSFVGADGQTYTVTYVADENGFQPNAPFLPPAAGISGSAIAPQTA